MSFTALSVLNHKNVQPEGENSLQCKHRTSLQMWVISFAFHKQTEKSPRYVAWHIFKENLKGSKEKTGRRQFNNSCPVHLAYSTTKSVYVQPVNIKFDVKGDNKVSCTKKRKTKKNKKKRTETSHLLRVIKLMQFVHLQISQLTSSVLSGGHKQGPVSSVSSASSS